MGEANKNYFTMRFRLRRLYEAVEVTLNYSGDRHGLNESAHSNGAAYGMLAIFEAGDNALGRKGKGLLLSEAFLYRRNS